MIRTASWTVRNSAPVPARTSTRMISSGPYALELMLSLKTASALALLRRSCPRARWRWAGRSGRCGSRAARRASRAGPGSSSRTRSASFVGSLELILEGTDDADVGVAGTRAALPPLTSRSGSTRRASGPFGSGWFLCMSASIVLHAARHRGRPRSVFRLWRPGAAQCWPVVPSTRMRCSVRRKTQRPTTMVTGARTMSASHWTGGGSNGVVPRA